MPEGEISAFDLRAIVGDTLGSAASIGVMLVLLAIGFKLTYLDNATFGASCTDWLGLVFWGLAAYGTRQTLTGLGPSPAPASSGS
jgi:predicted cobalt transporter CbtA